MDGIDQFLDGYINLIEFLARHLDEYRQNSQQEWVHIDKEMISLVMSGTFQLSIVAKQIWLVEVVVFALLRSWSLLHHEDLPVEPHQG